MAESSVGFPQWGCVGRCHLRLRVGEQKDIWGRGDFLQIWYNGKELKVIHHDSDIPHTQQQPEATRCHVPPAACRSSGISTFVHPATSPFLLSCPGRFKNASTHPTPKLANAVFIITHHNNHSGQFIWWQGVTIRGEQGCRCHQMLLHPINWVSATMLFQEVRATGPRPGPMGAQKRSWGQLLRDTDNKPRFTSCALSFPYRSLK